MAPIANLPLCHEPCFMFYPKAHKRAFLKGSHTIKEININAVSRQYPMCHCIDGHFQLLHAKVTENNCDDSSIILN